MLRCDDVASLVPKALTLRFRFLRFRIACSAPLLCVWLSFSSFATCCEESALQAETGRKRKKAGGAVPCTLFISAVPRGVEKRC